MNRQPCQTHDIPEGAQYCIECGAPRAAEGRTTRLTLEDRALSGEGDLYVTKAEYESLLCDYRTAVYVYEGNINQVTVTRFFGRTVIVSED